MNIKILRFLNLLLDTIVFLIIICIFFSIFKNFILEKYVYWVSVILYFLYYFIQEYFFKKTVGKFFTKTTVVLTNNDNLLIKIFIRSISRFIIIDLISLFFYEKSLHDFMSKTQTVKLK